MANNKKEPLASVIGIANKRYGLIKFILVGAAGSTFSR
jgi:hypothetical protein